MMFCICTFVCLTLSSIKTAAEVDSLTGFVFSDFIHNYWQHSTFALICVVKVSNANVKFQPKTLCIFLGSILEVGMNN